MKRTNYQGRTYNKKEGFHRLLREEDQLIIKRFGENRVVVGAPHHTPKGIVRMPYGKIGDENTGYLARDLADHLRGTMVVAANPNHDPNKNPGDYLEAVLEGSPALFIEVHGHYAAKSEQDIEISCGCKELEDMFASRLGILIPGYLKEISWEVWKKEPEVGREMENLKIEGDYDEICFKAAETRSIQEARARGIIPYHISYGLKIREIGKKTNRNLPGLGRYVAEATAATVAEIHEEVIERKSKRLRRLLGE